MADIHAPDHGDSFGRLYRIQARHTYDRAKLRHRSLLAMLISGVGCNKFDSAGSVVMAEPLIVCTVSHSTEATGFRNENTYKTTYKYARKGVYLAAAVLLADQPLRSAVIIHDHSS